MKEKFQSSTQKLEKTKPQARGVSFERQMYIPKKTIQKTERTLTRSPKIQDASSTHGVSWLRRGLIIFLWVLFVCELVYILLFAQFFVPRTIHLVNVPEEVPLESFLRSQFEGRYFGMVEKNNLLLSNTEELEKEMEERYPRLASVQIQKKLPETLEVEVTVLPYQILWCRGGQCFLLNENGVLRNADIFFQYPEEQGVNYTVRDESGTELTLGQQVFSKAEVNFLAAVIRDFSSRTGLEKQGDFVRPSLYTKEIRLQTAKGFWVYLSTEHSLETSLNNLVLFLDKEVPKEEWGELEYVDLRTENRVYYTRKDRQPENPQPEIKEEEQKSDPAPTN